MTSIITPSSPARREVHSFPTETRQDSCTCVPLRPRLSILYCIIANTFYVRPWQRNRFHNQIYTHCIRCYLGLLDLFKNFFFYLFFLNFYFLIFSLFLLDLLHFFNSLFNKTYFHLFFIIYLFLFYLFSIPFFRYFFLL